MNGSCALTTFDNPFDPFERFSDWFLFDVGKVTILVLISLESQKLLNNFPMKRTNKRLNEQLMKSLNMIS